MAEYCPSSSGCTFKM
ncbi:unnamed protein product, partial [Rotaria sp. Silwood1]